MIWWFQQLRVPTLFCFAEWRRAVLHGKKPPRLTESEEHMLIDPPLNHKPPMLRKKSVPKIHPCHVGIFKKIRVPTK